jgi:hypothetical protein
MEATIATRIEAEYPRVGLRTRGRHHLQAGCHAPGCRHRAPAGKRFCSGCQETLDRVRNELTAAKPRRRKPTVRSAA